MVSDSDVRILFRAVHHNSPTRQDFRSAEELGLTPRYRLSAQKRRQWAGLSMEDDRESLTATMRQNPSIGRYIAEIHIRPDMNVTIEQTGRLHHYTVWGDAQTLLGAVVAVRSVE